MKHVIPDANWHMALADTIELAQDGDEIVCQTESMAELGERARVRMCPDKQLTFTVEENLPTK